MKTNSRVYELNAWRDNNIIINCTQGEYSELTFTGSSLTDIKGKKINFQLYDEDGLIDLSDVDEVYYDAVNEQGEQSACDALVINKTTNTVILGLSKTMTFKSGKVKGEIRLVTSKVDGNNKITSTNTKFYGVNLKVNKSNDDGGLIDNPQFSELEKLITYIKIAGKITGEDIDFAKYLIDDNNVAINKTYSSSKIEELINVIETNITDNKTKVELLTSLVNSLINDAQSSNTTTYSSAKIEEITTEINKKISDAKEQLPRRIVVTVDNNGDATFSLSNLPVAEGKFDDEIT
jgi:hypothetical protein